MDSKMLKNQEPSEQLQNKELEALTRRRLDDLVKNFSLRNKFAKWVLVAASIVGSSVSMTMPVQAVNRVSCNEAGYMQIIQGRGGKMCFANGGDIPVVIADVHKFYSGNNAGYIETNKVRLNFGKWQGYDFAYHWNGPVTVLRIVIY